MSDRASNRQTRPKKLVDLIEEMDSELEGDDEFSIGDVLDAFGSRSFGPLLTLPALLMVSPLGGIPVVPTVLAAFVGLISAQHLLGLDHPWLPKLLADRSVSKSKWEKAEDNLLPWAKRIDAMIKPRLAWLVSSPMDRAISLIVLVLAALVLPLEAVPFAVMVPGSALFMLGLAMSARDGVVALGGFLVSGATVYATLVLL